MSDVAVSIRSTPTSRLVEFLLSLKLENLPQAIVREAHVRLLDSLGCGLYGVTTPWGRIAARVVYEERSQGGATVYGHSVPATPARAALVNATATHGIEFDDLVPGFVHPGALVIPAILAITEHYELSGRRLLLGLIAGYEATSRIGVALGEIEDWGFHTSGIAGPAGVAIACGVTLGMTQEQTMRAVGIACSYAAGIRSFTQGDGGMIKRMHAGRAAESGVLACALARHGYTAPLAAMDGKFGLLQTYGRDGSDAQLLDSGLGASYVISKVRTKCYPCYYGSFQAMLEALQTLRNQHGIAPEAIERVRIGTNKRAVGLHGEVSPKDTMAAQYSMPFASAVALASDPKDPRSYSGDALHDPTVCAIARRVEIFIDPEIEAMKPPRRAAYVEVRLTNGKTLNARLMDAHGSPENPCSETEIQEKFRILATASNTEASIAEILRSVEQLETLPSISTLSQALRNGALC